ncbi:GGDEF domain-containing protein [Pseudomonas batumici]|uniref:diguanylate cyclase n=1 Tax=Pseudomonas batumici TaxID=226910 RepID=A0A0C2I976_9PSED|nr:GGDEF domain-containing protein [Pseudomonas batumici]KIH81607.1 GGDEF domain protein [Pseudomonas batumici]
MTLLHIPTLLLVSVFIFCLMGLLSLHAWLRETRERCLAYLGSMMLLASLGLLLGSLRGMGIDFVPIVLGNVILLLSAAMNWTAMRVFAGRPPSVPGILAGAATWLALCLVPTFLASFPLRVSAYSALAASYGGLTLLEFWRSRHRLEASYLPALTLTALQTLFYCVRIFADTGMGPARAFAGNGEGLPFFSFLLFESMVYMVGIGYVTLAMVKERAERQLKAAAYSDPLTNIGNRRSFMLKSETLLADCERRGTSAALLLCDLDHFKRLNDTFGHAVGDQALIAFSRMTTQILRPADVFGRIGGEEFACVLGDSNEARAVEVAERIRAGFSGLALLEPGFLSVSIGLVSTGESGYELSRLLSVADEALYGAKGKGRDRVEVAQAR